MTPLARLQSAITKLESMNGGISMAVVLHELRSLASELEGPVESATEFATRLAEAVLAARSNDGGFWALVALISQRDAQLLATAKGAKEREIRMNEVAAICRWLRRYQDTRYADAALHIACNYFDPGNPGDDLGVVRLPEERLAEDEPPETP